MTSKREQTKQNIIDAFWSLYEVTRIEKITVKDIAMKAGYNRSTFYEYFTDVYDVLETIENALIPTENTLPEININGNTVGFDPLKQLDFFHKNKKYLKILLGENGNPAFIAKLKNSIKPMILNLIPDTNKIENFDYILEYTISGMIGVMSYHIQNEEHSESHRVIQTIKEMSSRILDFK